MRALLVYAVLASATGCEKAPPAPVGEWRDGTVSYQVAEVKPATNTQAERRMEFDLTVERATAGSRVTERGRVREVLMEKNGKLALKAKDDPPVLYEPLVLAILPPPGMEMKVGQRWSVTRPDDADASASEAVVGQEKYEYEIASVTADAMEVTIKGYLRIAPSAGLDAFVADTSALEAAVVKTAASNWSFYAEGTATFNLKDGATQKAAGTRVPFGFLRGNTSPANAPTAVTYAVTRR